MLVGKGEIVGVEMRKKERDEGGERAAREKHW